MNTPNESVEERTGVEKRRHPRSIKEVLKASVQRNLRQYTMVFALLAIWIIFSILTKSIFLSTRNLSNLFRQTASVAIVAMGMVLIIVSGNIDLSVGSVVGFIGAVAAALQVRAGLGVVPAILLAIGVGFLIGCWQGYWIAYRGVPAFIVTLSSMLLFRGATYGVTEGVTIGPLPKGFSMIGKKYLLQFNLFKNDSSVFLMLILIFLFIIFETRKRRTRIKFGFHVLSKRLQALKILGGSLVIALIASIMIRFRGVPNAILVVLILAAMFYFLAHNTTFGRQIYAIGGNREAARLSGINVQRRLLVLFIIMGVLTSIAAIVFTSRLGGAYPGAGTMMELDVIASAVIGGTSFSGGVGSVLGGLVGALVMASLDNGMTLMDLDVTYQLMVKGIILLLAVWFDISSRKKQGL